MSPVPVRSGVDAIGRDSNQQPSGQQAETAPLAGLGRHVLGVADLSGFDRRLGTPSTFGLCGRLLRFAVLGCSERARKGQRGRQGASADTTCWPRASSAWRSAHSPASSRPRRAASALAVGDVADVAYSAGVALGTIVVAVATAYVAGLTLLPVFVLLERFGWRGVKVYMGTGALAGWSSGQSS
jgi:hypothetical protein